MKLTLTQRVGREVPRRLKFTHSGFAWRQAGGQRESHRVLELLQVERKLLAHYSRTW